MEGRVKKIGVTNKTITIACNNGETKNIEVDSIVGYNIWFRGRSIQNMAKI